MSRWVIGTKEHMFKSLCVFRSYNGWHRDAHSLRAWALRWDRPKDLWLCWVLFKACSYYHYVVCAGLYPVCLLTWLRSPSGLKFYWVRITGFWIFMLPGVGHVNTLLQSLRSWLEWVIIFFIMIQPKAPVTSVLLKGQWAAQIMLRVWLTDSSREGSRREDRLSGSSTHLPNSWNQLLPDCQILPLSGNTEGNTLTIIYFWTDSEVYWCMKMLLWCACFHSMNKAESTSTAGMLIRLPTQSDSDYINCFHSHKTNQRCVTLDVNVSES